MAGTYKRLIYERKGKDGEVLYLTLNNEKMMNAITETMQNELVEVMGETARDNTIRCVVLTGVGEKVFSARRGYPAVSDPGSRERVRPHVSEGKISCNIT